MAAGYKHKSSKKFFWAITSQTELFMSGYLRIVLSRTSPPDTITLLISKFVSDLFIDSKILRFDEIDSFLSLLANQWKERKLSFKLLHRGSDHGFNSTALKEALGGKYDEYVMLIHTNHGHTFGIYKVVTDIEFGTQSIANKQSGFEFVIRSKKQYLPKLFPMPARAKLLANCLRTQYFPDDKYIYVTSVNCGIAINTENIVENNSLCIGEISSELCGSGSVSTKRGKFKVIDIEIFQINFIDKTDQSSPEPSDPEPSDEEP